VYICIQQIKTSATKLQRNDNIGYLHPFNSIRQQ